MQNWVVQALSLFGKFDGTALNLAARYNKNPEIITALIKASARVNVKSKLLGRTALHFAAEYNENPAVIATLTEAGAKVNTKGWLGRSALYFAARYNANPEVIVALVKVGAKVDDRIVDLANDNEKLNQDIVDLLEKTKRQQRQWKTF